MTCGEPPRADIFCVFFNGTQMGGDVKAPSRAPILQFRAELCPLFFNASDVFPLMVQQQGCGLDEPLNQQHLFARCRSVFEKVPQIFPCLMGVPELSIVKQCKSLLEQWLFLSGERASGQNHRFGRAGSPLKQFVFQHNRRTLQEGVW